MSIKRPEDTVYIVTGVSGFIGFEIADQLCKEGYVTRGLIRKINPITPFPKELELIKGDILDIESLEKLYHDTEDKKTVMIHSAAYLSVKKNDPNCEHINIQGTKNIIEICKKYSSKLVYISSVDTLDNSQQLVKEPDSFNPDIHFTSYARSKAIASQLVLDEIQKGLDGVIILPSAVAGPNDYRKGFIYDMLSIYLNGITLFSIKGGYDFVDVRDVAKATITAALTDTPNKSYIISNKYADITEIYCMIADYLNIPKPKVKLPLWALYAAIPFMSIWCKINKKECPLSSSAIKIMGQFPNYSNERAKKDLGFSPRPLNDTFKDTIDFIISQKKLTGNHKGKK
ncbi:MAG: NAD-dependent epimerase/dehydratase family protein [Clostridia bacterium]|nr:NAD-dependent epimerase/dehydratase family protein [Clostridia bacterium]